MIGRIRSKVSTIGVAVAMAACLATAAYAQDGGRRGPGGPGGRMGFPGLAALNLSDAQRQQVREVMQRHREEMQTVGKQLHDAFDAQREAVEAVPVNEALIRSTSQSLANVQVEMALLRARVHSEVWSLLTPDQQQTAKELKDKREARMKDRAQRFRQRRQGQ